MYLKFRLKFSKPLWDLNPFDLVFEIKNTIFWLSLANPIVAWLLVVLKEPLEYPISMKSSLKSSNVDINMAPPYELPNNEELLPL